MMTYPSIDYSLYLVTDRDLSRGRSTLSIVTEAVVGGVSCVQLREKCGSTRMFMEEARAIKGVLAAKKIPLIINDRVDVALAVGASGVHLGQSDMPIADARRLLPSGSIIGISVESLEDAVRAEGEGADYIGVSPVFSTPTKRDTAPPLGLSGVRRIREAVGIPIVGIGGISSANGRDVIDAGAHGIAVVSAIVSADDPRLAALSLKQAVFSSEG